MASCNCNIQFSSTGGRYNQPSRTALLISETITGSMIALVCPRDADVKRARGRDADRHPRLCRARRPAPWFHPCVKEQRKPSATESALGCADQGCRVMDLSKIAQSIEAFTGAFDIFKNKNDAEIRR
jgi:hypothetical protein